MSNKILWAGLNKEKGRLIIYLLGLRISLPSSKAKIKKIESWYDRLFDAEFNAYHATRGNMWLYSNIDKFTEKEITWFISQKFYENVGYYPNLKNPKSFNEKIQWMKLHYSNPTESICIDKYRFKEYITKKLGPEYVVPLLGVYDSVDDIDFDKLPDKFVLKMNDTGGGQYGIQVVKNKKELDIDKTKYTFNNWLQDWQSVYYYALNIGYKGIIPKIIAEEYIEQIDGQLYDYKFHCFHGEPKIVLVCKDRSANGYKMCWYDMNWNHLNVHRGNKDMVGTSEKPKHFDEMVRISKILSKDFPFVRVDFYETDDKLYVGELTFTPKSGFGKFEPKEFDFELGSYLDLSKIDKKYLKKPNYPQNNKK